VALKPFIENVTVHERGHVTQHNALSAYLDSGGIVLSGDSAPTSALGEVGDFYLDTTTAPYALYGPKGELGWPAQSFIAVCTADALNDAVVAVTAATDVATLQAALLGFLGSLTSS
jgi:hypothetical protein